MHQKYGYKIHTDGQFFSHTSLNQCSAYKQHDADRTHKSTSREHDQHASCFSACVNSGHCARKASTCDNEKAQSPLTYTLPFK